MNDIINISAAPHPFRAARADYAVPHGLSLAEMLNEIQPDPVLMQHAHVFINGEPVARHYWDSVKPKPCALVEIRIAPQGGGGGDKNPLRKVLSIAVLAAGAAISGGALAGAFGSAFAGGSIGATIASAAVGIAGNLLVNAIAPPGQPQLNDLSDGGEPDSPTLFIQGARNRRDPFGVVPQVLGRHVIVPPLAAQTFTESVGDDQYVRQLLTLGQGPLDISNLKIGDTPLDQFDEVETEIKTGGNDDGPVGLFPDQVSQVDLSVKLTKGNSWQVRTTDVDADEIAVDVTFPRGIVRIDKKGKERERTVEIDAEYADAGTGNWQSLGTITQTRKTTSAVRKTLRKTVTRGQYDVRLRRITNNADDDTDGDPFNKKDRIFDESVWSALKSFTNEDPINEPGAAKIAVRMKATDQLNGPIERLNVIAQTIAPDWDSGTNSWVERVTENPASLFRHVLQGPANARNADFPDSRVDLAKLQEWHEFCENKGLRYNGVIDYKADLKQVLGDVAGAGRAALSVKDNKVTVIIDQAQSVPVQHVTPRNSWDYKFEKAFPEIPHAFRVQFVNANKNWQQDERLVFDDGFDESNATLIETLELPGITTPEEAYLHGREHIASIRLRPETHSFMMDVENLVASRGDLIKFTHDVPLIGLGAGRVKDIETSGGDITSVTLDERLPMEAGKDYSLRFRLADGSSLVKTVQTVAGDTARFDFVSPSAVSAGPEIGDLAMFGETGEESIDLVIKAIEPDSDYNARVVAVDAAPEIFDAANGPIPDFQSNISLPPEFTTPQAPIITGIQTGEEVAVRNLDGSLEARMVISLQNPNAGQVAPLVKIKASGETDFGPAQIVRSDSQQIVLSGVESGEIYDVRVRYRRIGGGVTLTNVISSPAQANGVTVVGFTEKPGDVENFQISVRGDTVHLSWNEVDALDLSHYELRFTPETQSPEWGAAIPLSQQVGRGTTSLSVPSALGSYLIKAVDQGGRKSENAAAVTTTIGNLDGLNVVETIAEAPNFEGAHDGTVETGGNLELTGADTVDDWPNVDDVQNFDIGLDGIRESGTYTFSQTLDLGASYTSVITADIGVSGIDKLNNVDAWDSVDDVDNWDGSVNPEDYNATLEIRTTEDDPSGSPTWSAWKELTAGDYTARAFQFRVTLESLSSRVTPRVDKLTVRVDMPDRTASNDNIAVPVGGKTINFSPAFRGLSGIGVAIDDGEAGDRYAITNKSATGFTIEFFNDQGSSVARTMSYVAKGFGRVSI